jgi:hypothetical protein
LLHERETVIEVVAEALASLRGKGCRLAISLPAASRSG